MILRCGCEYEDASEHQTKACSVQHRDVYVGVLKDLEVAKLRMSELEDRVRRGKIAYDSLARSYEAIKDGPTCLSQELVNLFGALGSLFGESPGPHGGGSHPIVCDDWILPDGKPAGYPKFDDAIIRCRRCAERMLAAKKAFMAAAIGPYSTTDIAAKMARGCREREGRYKAALEEIAGNRDNPNATREGLTWIAQHALKT